MLRMISALVTVTIAGGAQAQVLLDHGAALADDVGRHEFGRSVVRYDDQLLVGASGTGLVIAFRRDAGAWTEFQRFGPALDPGHAGFAMAIMDGVLAVGAPTATGPNAELAAGAVRLYEFDVAADEWRLVQTLASPTPAEGGYFGTSLAANVDTLFVGEPHRATDIRPSGGRIGAQEGPADGYVHAYRRDAAEWQLIETVRGPLASEGAFGTALAADDDWLVVGAPGEDLGAVYLYSLDGAAVTHVDRHDDLDGEPTAAFGRSLSLRDGRVLVGSTSLVFDAPSPGRAFVYSLDGDGFQHLATLRDEASMFGYALAWLDDSHVAVAAPASGGVVFVFVEDNAGGWELTQRLVEPYESKLRTLAFGEVLVFAGAELFIGSPSAAFDDGISLPPAQTGSLYEFSTIAPPAVDLSLSVSAPAAAEPESPITVEFVVDGDPAEDIDLAFVTVRSLMPVVSAPDGCFELRDTVTRCEIGAVPAGESARLSLVLRTRPLGASPSAFVAYAGAERPDPDATDNKQFHQLGRVETPPAPPTPSSGGGSFGWFGALFLLAMLKSRIRFMRSASCSARISASPVSTPNSR